MSNKRLCLITAALCSLVLTACGLSEENLAKVTEARDALVTQIEKTENLNGELTEDTFASDLQALSAESEELVTMDLEKLKNKHVEETITRMNEVTDSYKGLEEKMSAALSAQEDAALELSKQLEILCDIENLSGSEFSSICFKDVTADTTTDNYLAKGVTLPNGRILAAVTLPVYSGSTGWCIVATDTLGNSYEYAVDFGDLTAAVDKTFSIKLNVPENGAEIN